MKWGHKIPAVPNPVGDICVEVTIPAHPDYIALFIRTVRILETNRIYQRDELNGETVKIVQAQWRERTVTPLIEALATGTGMCGVDGECLAYPPFANFIGYFPQNPYTEPDLIPPGFLAPPFYVNGKDAEHTLPNYETGDVIVNFAAINLEPAWNLDNTPRIELCLEGSGVVEIHFLNIVQGGIALVSVDNPVDLGDILAGIMGDGIDSIDLNQDIISLPPETAEEIIIEKEIPLEGEHIVYIYFLPTVNDSLIPLAFGGGLREISLCGNLRPCGTPAPEPPPPLEGVSELKPEFQFTADCGLEYRYRNQEDEIISDWQPVPGWTENFADCVGGVNMATKDDIRDGIYEAVNRLSLQLASGGFTNIHVDDDGNVTSGDEAAGNGGLPEDDPTTPAINESLAAMAGGCKAVTAGYNSIWSDMIAWHDLSLTEDVVIFYLQQKYMMNDEASVTTFVNNYYLAWATGHINSYTEVLSGMLFCQGGNFKNVVADYVISFVSTLEIQTTGFNLNDALSDEQITAWYEKGATVPSTDYYGYSCTKIPDETFIFDMATAEIVQITTAGVWKPGHRFLIDASGTYTDSDNAGISNDAMYSANATTGAKTFNPMTFNSAGGVDTPLAANVPYQASRHYQYTVDKKVGFAAGTCIISIPNTPFNLPNTTGTITVIVKDLGEFII